MKRLALPLSLLLTLFAAAPLVAVDSSQPPTLIQDVIRMTQGGVSDQAIIAFVQNRRGSYAVTADDMIAMADAKVSNDVMKFVADAAAQPGQAAAGPTNDPNWRNRRSTEPEEEDTRATRTRTVIAPRVYVSPWWWDPWYYYDPFWYGPRLSVGFGYYWGGYRGPFWGGRYYGGGHYGGGHYGGGGGHVQPRPGGGGGIIRRGR